MCSRGFLPELVVAPSKRHFPHKTFKNKWNKAKLLAKIQFIKPSLQTLFCLPSLGRHKFLQPACFDVFPSQFIALWLHVGSCPADWEPLMSLTDVKAEIAESEEVWTSPFERTDLKNGRIVGISSSLTIKAKCYLPKFCVLASNSRLSHQFQPNYKVFTSNLKGTNTRCKLVFYWRTHVW